MNGFSTGCQPCQDFTPDDKYMRQGFTHECPKCGGERVFCCHCFRDHHAGGWNICEPDVSMAGCDHPMCRERTTPKAVMASLPIPPHDGCGTTDPV